MKIHHSEQIKEIESHTVNLQQISWDDLMENAAKAFISQLNIDKLTKYSECVILCGSGNNAGDGIVIGRIISSIVKYPVKLILLDDFENKSNLRQTKLKDILINRNLQLYSIDDQYTIPEIKLDALVIDAIFGIGLNKPIRSPLNLVIETLNKRQIEIISVDVPSGLYSNRQNEGSDTILKASQTITFQHPKLSFFLSENIDHIGQLLIVDIGLVDKEGIHTKFYLRTKNDLKSELIHRKKNNHKGKNGKSVIIGGAQGMYGAPVLAARASLCSGAGYTSIYMPRNGWPTANNNPDIMLRPTIDSEYLTSIEVRQEDTVIIGPGLGTHQKTQDAFLDFLSTYNHPMVIDADALNILSHNETFTQIPAHSILTPHIGEFNRMAGLSSGSLERIEKQRMFSKKYKCIVVLKGPYTSISDEEGNVYFNDSGNESLAVGGTGDVLSGLIVSLLAQGYNPLSAAQIGVYIHGLAADLFIEKHNTNSLTASILTDYITLAMDNCYNSYSIK